MGLKVINKTAPNDRLSRNGIGFQGNYLDVQYVQYTLELDLRLDLRLKNPVFYDSSNNTLTLTSGNWVDFIGAFVGANVDIKFGTGGGSATSTTITAVSGAVMTISPASLGATGSKTAGYVEITDLPKDFELKYNLVRNSVANGTGSLIDGEEIRFRGVDVDLLAVSGTIDLTQLGNKSGGSIFDTKLLTRIADVSGKKRYTVDLTYKNWVCLSSADYFSGESVGDYAEFDIFMIASDPSTKLSESYFQAGNTGFENENFNGNPADYVLTSIDWEDNSANPLQAFDYTQDSNFTIVITKQSGSFNASDSFDFKMFTIPNDAGQYSNKPLSLDNNLMLAQNGAPIAPSTPTNITGNLNDLGAAYNIIGLTSTIATNTMTITGRVVPNNTFKTLFNSRVVGDRAYKVIVSVEDNTLTFDKSDRVNVLADSAQAQKNLIDLGSFGVTTLDFTDHNNDVYTGTPNLYLEDDVLVTVEYTIPKILSSPAVNPYVAIKGRIVIENTVTNERFTLEELVYDISSLPVLSDGTLPLDYLLDRGFKLPDTSDKKEFIVERNIGADTADVFGARMKYPFIVRYEDWISKANVPVDFYSTANENWYNYASAANWEIKFEHVIEENNTTNPPFVEGEYIDEQVFTINDYDDWGETSNIEFFTESGTPLTKPSGSENTVVRATHTLATDTWSGKEWVQIHARPFKNSPQWTGSTVLDASDNTNPLFPLVGQTKTTINVAAGTITSEVRFDFTKIDTTAGVTFTTRVKGDSLSGGERNNIFLLNTTISRKPFVPGIGDITDPDIVAGIEECRGIKKCCDVELKCASLTNNARKYNCITGVYLIADSYTVTLKDANGNTTNYTPPATTVFPNDPDALFVQIEWQDVLIQDGAGMYTVEISGYFLNSVLQTPFVWGEYELKPYESDGVYNREGTLRVLSKFNSVNDKLGINFTGANIYDSLIIDGKFGYNEPNTEVNNTTYLDGRRESVKREDFDSWELRTNLVSQYFIDRLRFHILAENETWLSDNNATSPSYFLFDIPLIVKEGYVPEYFDGSRLQKGVAVYEDKVRRCRTHFNDNRITAETLAPPAVNIPTPIVTGGDATLMKTGQTTSYATNDDGDLQAGRATDFFTLSTNNPFGNTNRFTDELGGQTYSNDIVIDWSTYNTVAGTVLGYYRTLLSSAAWSTQVSNAASVSIGSYTTGWRLTNHNEFSNIYLMSDNNFAGRFDALNYAPFSISIGNYLWTSTSRDASFAVAHLLNPFGSFGVTLQGKGNSYQAIACRTFTVSGTTLT